MGFESSVGKLRVLGIVYNPVAPVDYARFSTDTFRPIGSAYQYDGRMLSAPKISFTRDSSEFGILVFSASSIELNNADGYYDTLVTTYIGKRILFYMGYDDWASTDYVIVFTGYIESVVVNETTITLSITDLRKKLKGNNTTDISMDTNAVQAIENILIANYAISYTTDYFDTTAWNLAKTAAPLIYRPTPDNDNVQDAIEACVKSTMGFFFITGDGKYSYKMIDTDATSVTTISHYDILNEHSINYDTEDIVATLKLVTEDWSESAIGTYPVLDYASFSDTSMVRVNDTILMVGKYAGDYACSMATVLRSTNNGRTFEIVQLVAGAYASNVSPFLSLAIATAVVASVNSIVVCALTYPDAVTSFYSSADDGATWTDMSLSLGQVNYTVVGNGGNMMTMRGTNDSGLLVSYPSSTYYLSNLYLLNPSATSFTAVGPVTSIISAIFSIDSMYNPTTDYMFWGTANTLILAGGHKHITLVPDRFDTALTKSEDGGATWTNVTSFSAIQTYSIVRAVKIVTANIWLVAANRMDSTNLESYVYITTDAGATWKILTSSTGQYCAFSINTSSILCIKREPTTSPGPYSAYSQTVLEFNYATTASLIGNTVTELVTINATSENSLIHYNLSDNILNVFTPQISSLAQQTANTEATSATSIAALYDIDTFKEESTIVYNNSDILTLLADKYNYFNSLHGKLSITVPIKYYYVNVGDNVDVEIWRETVEMLGTTKCEVMGKSYDFDSALITFDLRII